MKCEITSEIKEKFRLKYGEIIDFIRIKEIKPKNNEMNFFRIKLDMYNDFGISKFDSPNPKLITELQIDKFCNYLDGVVFNRNPNRAFENLNVYINHNIPNDIIYISPKTYTKIMKEFNSIKWCD